MIPTLPSIRHQCEIATYRSVICNSTNDALATWRAKASMRGTFQSPSLLAQLKILSGLNRPKEGGWVRKLAANTTFLCRQTLSGAATALEGADDQES